MLQTHDQRIIADSLSVSARKQQMIEDPSAGSAQRSARCRLKGAGTGAIGCLCLRYRID